MNLPPSAVTALGMPSAVQAGQVRLNSAIVGKPECEPPDEWFLYRFEQPRSQKDAKW
jgi:hypothetical protein